MIPLWLLKFMPNPRAALELAVVIALAGLIGWAIHHERDVGRHEIQLKWDADLAVRKAAADRAQAQSDAESARRIATLKEIEHDAQSQVIAARADAASAADSAQRLRQRFAALARRGGMPGNPASAAGGASAPSAGDLQADVFGRVVEAARQLAATADGRGPAGQLAADAYDALTPSPQTTKEK